jgi:hypothetical protein
MAPPQAQNNTHRMNNLHAFTSVNILEYAPRLIKNCFFEIFPWLNYSSRMVFIWPFLPHFCLCLQGNVMGTACLKSTCANHCSKSTCPLCKSQKPLWSMLGTGHSFVPSVMAVRNLGEPSSFCAGFTAHSKYAMGLGLTEWTVKPTQWLLGSPKFLTAITLGTNGLYPAHSITIMIKQIW